jgi:large subunit ribosomal protein L2
LEITPFSKGKLIKSAWNFWVVVWRDTAENITFVKLPSWQLRKFHTNCRATIWELWNENHKNVVIWKAWRSRWMWRKPEVLWVNMNPVDHPHWGWEWHAPIWLKAPKAFNGRKVPAGKKTRSSKKYMVW